MGRSNKKKFFWFFRCQEQGVKRWCGKKGQKWAVPAPLTLILPPNSSFSCFLSEPGLKPRAGNKRNYLVAPRFSSPAWGLIKGKWKKNTSERGEAAPLRYRPGTRGAEKNRGGEIGGKEKLLWSTFKFSRGGCGSFVVCLWKTGIYL